MNNASPVLTPGDLHLIRARARRIAQSSVVHMSDLRQLATEDVAKLTAEIERLWEFASAIEEHFAKHPEDREAFCAQPEPPRR